MKLSPSQCTCPSPKVIFPDYASPSKDVPLFQLVHKHSLGLNVSLCVLFGFVSSHLKDKLLLGIYSFLFTDVFPFTFIQRIFTEYFLCAGHFQGTVETAVKESGQTKVCTLMEFMS